MDTHLTLRVGEMSLHDWIKADLSRGALIPLGDLLWCWEVSDKSIERCRQTLEFSGLLIAPRGVTTKGLPTSAVGLFGPASKCQD